MKLLVPILVALAVDNAVAQTPAGVCPTDICDGPCYGRPKIPLYSPTAAPKPATSSSPVADVPPLESLPEPEMRETSAPTSAPVPSPTSAPVPSPTSAPVPSPTSAPVPSPTSAPVPSPTSAPVSSPTSPPVQLASLPVSNPTPPPTKSPTPPPTTLDNTRELCVACGDKSPLIEGNGKVTGGGWIYLTNYTYYDPDKVCNPGNMEECSTPFSQTLGPNMDMNPLEGKKANFGFNAMFRHGKPYGSTNFGFDGGHFHFHSTTQNTPYNFLEVVDEFHARWFGTGTLATTVNPKKSDYRPGFCFMVSVIDKGEPGDEDTWRLRIWQCEGKGKNSPLDLTPQDFAILGSDFNKLVFDTNFVPPNHPEHNAIKTEYPLPNTFEATDPARDRFHGTELGEVLALGGGNGGGNIQIHKKGKMTPNLNALLNNNGRCDCAATPYEGDCSTGFVTGGGWILLQQDEVFLDGTDSSSLHGVKANFGFNAKAFHGEPTGSTNFNIEGNMFHFHTDNSGTEYDGLEVVCNSDQYGPAAKTVYARWTGVGKVSRTANPDDGWQNGYRFYVTVQDNGEPGFQDTFRIKIYYPDGKTKLFDSYDVGEQNKPLTVWDHDPECGPGNQCKQISWKADFSGNELGGLHASKKGGGNVQTHCKGGPNKCPSGMVSDYVLGSGAPAPTGPVPTAAPTTFTASSGSVLSDTTDFAAITGFSSCGTSTCAVGSYKCGGTRCSYTAGKYVTLVDQLGHDSSVFTPISNIQGKTKFTVIFKYYTDGFTANGSRFHVSYSFDETARTANFKNMATYGGSSSICEETQSVLLAGDQKSMILRFTSDTSKSKDELHLLSVTYKVE